jgi:hypothetical protein
MSTMERPGNNLEEYYSAEYVGDWQQLRDLYESRFRTGPQWIFRGQQQSAWRLQSRFEREMTHCGIALEQAARIEDGLLSASSGSVTTIYRTLLKSRMP